MRTVMFAVALTLAGHTAHADGAARTKKTLQVNRGSRVKPPNQYEAPIDKIALGFGSPGLGMTGTAFVRIEGPNLTPSCVIHFGSFTEALALVGLLQSDKLVSIGCYDEMVASPSVVIQHPPRPPNPSDCPRGLSCIGQHVDIDVLP